MKPVTFLKKLLSDLISGVEQFLLPEQGKDPVPSPIPVPVSRRTKRPAKDKN